MLVFLCLKFIKLSYTFFFAPLLSLMTNNQDVINLIQQLQVQYPASLKRNYLFYSMLKVRGLFDEIKEALPWLLASMIFIPITISLYYFIQGIRPQFDFFQASGFAILVILVMMMLYVPLVIVQAKQSSDSIYQYLKNTPVKLTILIALQGINILYLQSSIFQYILFFFALSFGFVRLYKENLFLEKTTTEQFFYLQQIRRACFWASKQHFKYKALLKISTSNSPKHAQYQEQLQIFHSLQTQLFKYENKLCNQYKHQDFESYMDSID